MKRVASALILVACGSAPPPSPGVDPPTVSDCAARDQNPYGACYPTGDVLPNTCFGAFCFAQLYDPEQRSAVRLIHITGVASWNQQSSIETDFITGSNASGENPSHLAWASELAPRVDFVQMVVGGQVVGYDATQADLDQWLQTHGAGVATILDEEPNVFYDAEAVPLNIDVDPRTMRIIDTVVGFDAQLDHSLEQTLASL